MKSSRNRFAEFRAKMKSGKLDPQRYADPEQKKTAGFNPGGRHADTSGPHVFKRQKSQLFHEYRVMLKGYESAVLRLLSIITLSTLLSVCMPFVLKILIDYICNNKGLSEVPTLAQFPFLLPYLPTTPQASLTTLALTLVVISLISIACDWLRMLAFQRINFGLAGSLRQRLHNHLIRLPLSLLADYKTGGVVSRIMGDTDQIVGGVNNAIVIPYQALLRVFIIVVVLFFTNWQLALVITLMIPPILLIHSLLFRRLRPMWRNIQDDRSTIAARLTDMYGGIRVVRSFQRERSEVKEFTATQDTMIRKQQYTAILGRILGTGWGIFGPAITVVIIWYGGSMVLSTHLVDGKPVPKMSLGDLVLFQSLILMLLGPVTQMIDSFQNLQQNLGALDRVVDVLEQQPDMPDRPHARAVNHLPGVGCSLTLRNLHFGYKPDRLVLHGVDLHIPAGATIAIVGPSGSGKTTLVNLLARFFDVTSGAIQLDGLDIRDLKVADYRALFAMVLQDVYLFDGSVAANISYGRRHASLDEIRDAARQANAHDFIMELEKGYDTIVGERGNKLSGGQKQRISIARAILANPQILILDEATSSLDTHSEHLIQDSLRNLMTQRTTFVIAHRLSTIMHANLIVVLVEGRIVEQGTHEELLEKHGVYFEMFTQQFNRHRDPTLERIEWELAKDAPTT